MIEIKQLTKTLYSGRKAVEILRGITLDIISGQAVVVAGPSGSGKSTLLGLIAGFDSPTSGQVILDGTDLSKLDEDGLATLRGCKMGFVFQSYNLIPTLTAEENVMLPMELAGKDAIARGRARELLETVGLGDRISHYPVQLSGGEQQRVALARAFSGSPSILLADEPTGNLDSVNGEMVLNLLFQLKSAGNTTLVVVTHDSSLFAIADRKIVLRDGQVVADEVLKTQDSILKTPSSDDLRIQNCLA
jgi:putative ABC transport system ATP-binding protein